MKVCFSGIMVLNNKRLIDFLSFLLCLKSGLLVFLSLIIFHQSVLSLLASDHSIPLHHELSWSVVCMGCAGTLTLIAGVLFLLLALPHSSWQKCLPNRNTSSLWHGPFVIFSSDKFTFQCSKQFVFILNMYVVGFFLGNQKKSSCVLVCFCQMMYVYETLWDYCK